MTKLYKIQEGIKDKQFSDCFSVGDIVTVLDPNTYDVVRIRGIKDRRGTQGLCVFKVLKEIRTDIDIMFIETLC